MKLLLDENLPRRLKKNLAEFDVSTVVENGWAGKKNGELMVLMSTNGFSVLITFDKNLQHQQNFKKYELAVLVLSAKDNTYATLSRMIPEIIQALKSGLSPGPKVIQEIPEEGPS